MAEKRRRFYLSPPFQSAVMKRVSRYLEPDNRSKRRAQVIVRAVVEIHFVANIETQTDRPEMPFKTATGIESPHHVVIAQTGNRARESSKCGGRIIQAEIDETAFGGNK